MKAWPIWLLLCALPGFEFALDKPGDSVETSSAGDSVEFLVTSQTGIGSVDITPGADWPRHVSFRLRYGNGDAFRHLEGVGLSAADWRVNGSLRRSGQFTRDYPDQPGRLSDECDIRVDRAEGMRIVLPPGFLRGRQVVTFGWIDAYR